jgi:hypothetical protein
MALTKPGPKNFWDFTASSTIPGQSFPAKQTAGFQVPAPGVTTNQRPPNGAPSWSAWHDHRADRVKPSWWVWDESPVWGSPPPQQGGGTTPPPQQGGPPPQQGGGTTPPPQQGGPPPASGRPGNPVAGSPGRNNPVAGTPGAGTAVEGSPGGGSPSAGGSGSDNPVTGSPGGDTNGGSGAGGIGGEGMSGLSGFASRYTPAMLDQIYENPWYILRDVFSGINESSPMYQALRDMGGDPLTIYNIMQGSNGTLTGAGDFANWLANMYGEQGKVGGQSLNAQTLLNSLFGQTQFGADAGNTLGQILGAGDMSTQIRTLFNMVKDVTNMGMNPLAARGYQSAIAQAGDRYGSSMMSQPAGAEGPQNPAAWIRENFPQLMG